MALGLTCTTASRNGNSTVGLELCSYTGSGFPRVTHSTDDPLGVSRLSDGELCSTRNFRQQAQGVSIGTSPGFANGNAHEHDMQNVVAADAAAAVAVESAHGSNNNNASAAGAGCAGWLMLLSDALSETECSTCDALSETECSTCNGP